MSGLLRRHVQSAAAYASLILISALIGIAVAVYSGYDESTASFGSRRMLALLVAGISGCIVAVAVLSYAYRTSRGNRRSGFWVPVVSSFVAAVLMLGVAEVALRLVAQPTSMGHRVGSLELIPYEWERVRAINRQLWDRSQQTSAYFVPDTRVGWAVGSSRESEDGLYLSSKGGLRSAVRGEEFQSVPVDRRIGMFGNSFVFSEEVSYEDSLGPALEKQLSEGYRTLNFGVPGYGVDQSYLRFSKEIENWDMPVALYGFIADDIYRASNIYTFLKPSWQRPFSKPRFLLSGDALDLITYPTLTAQEMFSASSIFELPNLEHDSEFFAHNWNQNFALNSYVARVLVSSFPRYSGPADLSLLSELGARIIERFAHDAKVRGIRTLITYMPSYGDFLGQDRQVKDAVIEKLAEREVEVLDLSACLANGEERWQWVFVEDGIHYSRRGNEAAAACFSERLTNLLEGRATASLGERSDGKRLDALGSADGPSD